MATEQLELLDSFFPSTMSVPLKLNAFYSNNLLEFHFHENFSIDKNFMMFHYPIYQLGPSILTTGDTKSWSSKTIPIKESKPIDKQKIASFLGSQYLQANGSLETTIESLKLPGNLPSSVKVSSQPTTTRTTPTQLTPTESLVSVLADEGEVVTQKNVTTKRKNNTDNDTLLKILKPKTIKDNPKTNTVTNPMKLNAE